MPRPTLFDHPKFHRLVHILALPEPYVLGHLEYLWRVGYASGNPFIGDSLDVEIAAKWKGERGVFTLALMEVRLIDQKSETEFSIHDLYDNAPDYVRSRARQEAYRKRLKLASEERKQATLEQLASFSSPMSRNGHTTVTDESRDNNPSPAPAPIQRKRKGQNKSQTQDQNKPAALKIARRQTDAPVSENPKARKPAKEAEWRPLV